MQRQQCFSCSSGFPGFVRRPLFFGLVVMSLGLFSCNLQNKIVLEGEGRGRMTLSLELPPYILDSIDILEAGIPGGEDLLKPDKMAQGLRRTKDISDVEVKSAKKGAYRIDFRFRNFERKSRVAAKDFLEWNKESNGGTGLSITINRETYRELERRFPAMRDNALLQLYGPATTEGMSRSDYLDMIEYSFGKEARNNLPEAEAVILIQVPGRIVSQKGGTKKGKNIVEFRLSLLDFALLNREKSYSIVYR
ncbi:hypothetical protein P0082_10455 [Candidatus Haliotispira prima]|uniref:Lipoprotein n=1 Tax=Candidatus Haliotispira prima TaxID=3034016 RepID=A0ABY8MI63_9SPIO|nr:hypothetical protein P0082_10455 [Candidatus Haliotispira prima]